MKKSFLGANEPFITEMIQVKTDAQAIERIKRAISGGATAVGVQMSYLEKQYRSEKRLTALFDACEDLPVYLTNYRGELNGDLGDDELTEGLLLGLKCGATLVDLMGDAFNPSPEELTTDERAITKQLRFIDEVHKRGGEVIMSSHIYKFRSAERVLEIALEQQRRGADIVKIVTGADTQEEELENLRICSLLKSELRVPFLFLSGGAYSRLHRTVGPALGVCSWLCFSEYDEFTYPGPPLLSEVLDIKRALKL